MSTATCPACHKTLKVEINLPEGPDGDTSTGVAIVCLYCAVPSVVLGNGRLALVDMSKLDTESRQALEAAIAEAKRPAAPTTKEWVNILTASDDCPVEMLPSLIPNGPVSVYKMPDSHDPVGRALEYEIRGDSLWALLELEANTDFSRAMTYLKDGRQILFIAVTHFSRDTLKRLGNNSKKQRPPN